MITTIMNLAEQLFLYMPLALGAYISFSLMKTPDLSIESAFLMGALAGASVVYSITGNLFMRLIIAVGASLVGGALVGLVSSCITRYGRIPHLLSSLITIGLVQGTFLFFSGPYLSLSAYDNPLIVYPLSSTSPEFVALAAIALFAFIFIAFLLRRQLGYALVISGSNPLFFNYFNLSFNYVFIAGIILANALAGLGGYLCAQTSNLVELNMGIGKAIFCITALILGKSIIRGQKNSLVIVPVGLMLYLIIQQVLLKLGFNLKFFTMVQSLVILLVVTVFYRKSLDSAHSLGV